ncbi:MAG: response regulator [Chloroflexi bacterium]|nr:response regulator [Chloroflexota bacterium]
MTPPLRALVVEDDQAWQQILVELLSDAGLSVDVAADLNTAEAILRAAPHRLAVVDLSLAGPDHRNRDGLQVLAAVRQLDPGCTAVLLTGFATVELAVSVLNEYNAHTCLRKETFRRRAFRQLIQDILALPHPSLAEPEPQSSAVKTTVTSSSPPPAASILVVDDDAGWRNVLSEILNDAGHQVYPCRSYGEAQGTLQRHDIALAIVDLALTPTLTSEATAGGYRLLDNLQQRHIPVLVLSGIATPHQIEDIYSTYSIHAFLEKQSFDRRAFRQLVEAALASAPGPPLAQLTPREGEVLELLAQGLTNKEIAQQLVISPNTVKRHTLAIFAKLEVSTRAAAAAKYLAARRQSSPYA